MEPPRTIGEYLIERLYELGVRQVFGVPGDFVLGFFDLLAHSRVQVINTCDEQGAGFAADAYARLTGLGVLCVTYCVGGLKVMNPVAQAYAEKSPVVVISGAPGIKERVKNPVLHHKVKDFDTQLRMFEQITVASTVLRGGERACQEIDRVLESALTHKRPVYIELPRDVVSLPAEPGGNHRSKIPAEADQDTFQEAVGEAVKMIDAAQKPVIIAGIELHRFGLQDSLLRFVEKSGIPIATTLSGKSLVSDRNPLCMGVYEGAMGFEDVRVYVESSDCLILLGAILSDVNLGGFTAHLDQNTIINATSEKVSIRHHSYGDVTLQQFLEGLIESSISKRESTGIPRRVPPAPFVPVQGRRLTVQSLFHRINSGLEDNTIVIAEPGDALFGAADLYIHGATEFFSPAYYLSLGFAIPAALGAQLARPHLRPLVLVGDGAFQMTGMELSTIVRFGLNPVVVVLNNSGYGTERPMMDGSFNDLLNWDYGKVTEIMRAGKSFDIETEDQLDTALNAALEYKVGFSILNVHLDQRDSSPALRRLTESLGKQVKHSQ